MSFEFWFFSFGFLVFEQRCHGFPACLGKIKCTWFSLGLNGNFTTLEGFIDDQKQS